MKAVLITHVHQDRRGPVIAGLDADQQPVVIPVGCLGWIERFFAIHEGLELPFWIGWDPAEDVIAFHGDA